jgi:tetratricopeptide (TPR) repeat protein
VFSWLSNLTSRQPAWQRASERASKALASERVADAWTDVNEALESCPEEARAGLEAIRVRAATDLLARNLEMSRGLYHAGDEVRGGEHLMLASQFAVTPELRQRVDAAIADRQNRRSGVAAAKSDVLEAASPIPDETDGLIPIDMIHPNFPEAVLDTYAGLPSRWRRAVVDMHQSSQIRLTDLQLEVSRRDSSVARYELAIGQIKSGDVAAAASTLEQGMELRPRWAGYLLLLAEANEALGRLTDAEHVLQAAADGYPDDIAVLVRVAQFALRRDDLETASDAVEAALEVHPEQPILTLLHAEVLDRKNQPAKSVVEFEKVVAQSWRVDFMTGQIQVNQDAAYGAALAYLKLGRSADAERALSLLAVVQRSMPEADAWRVDLDRVPLLRLRGQTDEAAELLAALEQRIPSDRPLAQLRWLELSGRDDDLSNALALLPDPLKAQWARAVQQRNAAG